MAVTLNASGESHAKSLIAAGKYDANSPWSFSAEDGDKILGSAGDCWSVFAQFHLGEEDSETDDTKSHYKYPYGKDGKVFLAALRAIRSRASQQGATNIFDAAGRLLEQIEKAGDRTGDGTSNVSAFRPAARAQAALGPGR